jgi:hypothetical protein
MSKSQSYPVEYRGNKIYDEKKAKELGDHLLLITDSYEVRTILDHIGVNHDPSSIILEDSYSSLFVDTKAGEYSEVWGIHRSTVHKNDTAVRLK